MSNTKKILLAWLFLGSIAFVSCKKEDVQEDNDEELITSTILTFTPVGGGTVLNYAFEDADGPGGISPVVDDIVLSPSTTYQVSVTLLNRTVSPVDTISNEVREEATSHRFYFETSAGSNLVIGSFDTDANGIDLGLNSIWTSGSASTGTVKLTLRHYAATPPNKLQADPVNSSKSSTDLEQTFNYFIQ